MAVVELVAALVIDLSAQRLYAYDASGRLLYAAQVSTGVAATPTPTGEFRIASRYPVTALESCWMIRRPGRKPSTSLERY